MTKHIKKLYMMGTKWNILHRYNDKVKKYFIGKLVEDKFGKPKK